MKYKVRFVEHVYEGGSMLEHFLPYSPDIEAGEMLCWDMKKSRTYEEAVEYFLPNIRLNGFDYLQDDFHYGEMKVYDEKTKEFKNEFCCYFIMWNEIGIRECTIFFPNMEELDKFQKEYGDILWQIVDA